MEKIGKSYLFIIIAILLGVLSGFTHYGVVLKGAETLSTLFMNFLQFIAAPIVFLSIFSTLLGMSGFGEMKPLRRKVFTYTVITSLIAAAVALLLYVVIHPARGAQLQSVEWDQASMQGKSYLSFFVNIVPSNLVAAFLENNVIGIAFISFLLGIAALKLPKENKESLNLFFSSVFKLILKVTEYLIVLMPFGIWAFVTLFVSELRSNVAEFKHLMLYLGIVIGANLVQGFVILPLFLLSKGLSPLKVARGASKALILAFFSKSSNAALPLSLECAQNRLGIKSKVANFSLPLCTVINMNGCAAFILTTVLFVSEMNGVVFTPWGLMLWIVLATIAAIGNAGVPMGCFFLSSTFLIAMGVPISMLGIILPFYAFIDMVETALNVWSDISVTAVVDKEIKKEAMMTPTKIC